MHRIDQEIADFWKGYGKPDYVKGIKKWNEVFDTADVMAYAGNQLTNDTYLRTLFNKAVIQAQTNPQALRDYYDRYYYTNERG